MEKELIAIDIETTGINYGQEMTEEDIIVNKRFNDDPNEVNEIIEITGLSKSENFDKFIKPLKIKRSVLEITGINEDDLLNGDNIENVIKYLYQVTRNKTVLVTNAPFTIGFIKYYSNKYNLEFDNEVIDLIELDRKYNSEGNHTLNGMAFNYNIDFDSLKNRSSSLAINEAMLLIYDEMKKRYNL